MKLLDKLKNKLKINKRLFLFLIVLLLIGITFGSIFITILEENDRTLVYNSLKDFFENIKGQKLDYFSSLKNSMLINLLTIFIIWLLGISVIGIPILIIIFFSKAFTIGFIIGSIIAKYGMVGCLLSIAYTFPHAFIFLLALAYLLMYSLSFSFKIIEAITKKKNLDFKILMNQYSKILFFTFTVGVICSLLEVFISPNFINIILPFVK